MDEQTEAVQRMQDYIGVHVTEKITLSDLARVSCFSPFYAHRLFRALHGVHPSGVYKEAPTGPIRPAAEGGGQSGHRGGLRFRLWQCRWLHPGLSSGVRL